MSKPRMMVFHWSDDPDVGTGHPDRNQNKRTVLSLSQANKVDGGTMSIFTVTMVHPDGEGWDTHLKAHVDYLLEILDEGRLIASGPVKGTDLRSGFLIISARDRREIEAIIAKDPFSIEDLIVSLTITEWDPVFGAFHDISSKQLPGGLRETH